MLHAPRRPPNDTGGPPLPIFLINLNQSVGRLRKMEAQLDGDRWSRVSAVYGDNVWPGCLQDRHGAGGSGCAADTVGSGAQGTPRLHPLAHAPLHLRLLQSSLGIDLVGARRGRCGERAQPRL